MDIMTIAFVLGLFLAALLLTITVRRDFVIKEEQRRDLRREAEHARPDCQAHRRPAVQNPLPQHLLPYTEHARTEPEAEVVGRGRIG